MPDVQISVELQAKIDKFVANLLAAANAADNTDNSVSKMSADISRNVANINRVNLTAFNNALSSGTLSLSNFGRAAAAVPAALPAITRGSAQAANALTNLGRVAQDAPFGFIGIQNNLNPLLESFQRLRAETGSNGAALKALGSSLIGPAGLGIALSVVSSAILIYQQYQQKANKATNDAKKSTDDYINSLDAVTAAQLKGAENAQKELTDIKLLYEAYQNANLPLKTRKEAYDQLQDGYPEYFKNIKFEEVATKKTTDAYTALTNEILASARARAASDKITKNETRKLENEQKVIDLQKEQLKNQAALERANKRGAFNTPGGSIASAGSAGAAESTVIKATQKQINDLKTDSNLLDKESLRLAGYVNSELEKGGRLIADRVEAPKKAQETRKNTNNLPSLAEAIGIDPGKTVDVQAVIKPLAQIVTGAELTLAKLKNIYGYSDDDLTGFITNYGYSLTELLTTTEKFNADLLNILNNGAISTLENFGASIGDALANGGNVLEAAGQSLLSSLGTILVDFGKLTLAAGLAATALGKALSNPLNPASAALAIGAGIALIAIGTAVGAFAKNIGSGKGSSGYDNVKPIPGFASGVDNFKGGMAIVGERGPELVDLPTGASVLNNNRSRSVLNNSGGSNIVLNGSLELGLDRLYVKLQQTGKRLDRRGV